MSTVETRRFDAAIGCEKVQATTFGDFDPSSGEVLAEIARCGEKEIDQAVCAARTAFEEGWRQISPAERGRLLLRLSDLISSGPCVLLERRWRGGMKSTNGWSFRCSAPRPQPLALLLILTVRQPDNEQVEDGQ